jgi:hypothetical protein
LTIILRFFATAVAFLSLAAPPVHAQIVEIVGSRAAGMGGAFVAVADDSSATWWNPAGLAAGPFLDLALARSVAGVEQSVPARRDRASWFALGTPPFGFSYYRLRLTDIQPPGPAASTPPGADSRSTGAVPAGREDTRAGVPVQSLSASQLGATFVQTLLPGIHAGATVKYVRGSMRSSQEDDGVEVSDLLDRGDELEDGDSDGQFDVDAGVLAVIGAFRVGAALRNATDPHIDGVRLPRQVRAGAAFDADRAWNVPMVVALDVDLRAYPTAVGERRVIALGAERWLADRRVGVRGGARFNLAGAEERAAAAGVSVALRSAVYAEGHAVLGGSADERGWGLAVRVSF